MDGTSPKELAKAREGPGVVLSVDDGFAFEGKDDEFAGIHIFRQLGNGWRTEIFAHSHRDVWPSYRSRVIDLAEIGPQQVMFVVTAVPRDSMGSTGFYPDVQQSLKYRDRMLFP